MKRLAVYVQHLTKYDAQALLLASGAPVTARFATGDRASNQPIDHAQIVAMVQEAAPAEVLGEIRAGRAGRFGFEETGTPVTVEVTPSGNVWKLTITPGAFRGAAPASSGQTGQFAAARAPSAVA